MFLYSLHSLFLSALHVFISNTAHENGLSPEVQKVNDREDKVGNEEMYLLLRSAYLYYKFLGTLSVLFFFLNFKWISSGPYFIWTYLIISFIL